MPNNKEIELKLTGDDIKYDLNKHIYLPTNLGNVKMDFKDALDIMHALLDATYHLNAETEQIIDEIEYQYIS